MKRFIVTTAAATAFAGALALGADLASAQPASCNVAAFDINDDGRVNQADATLWEGWFESNDMRADTDGDGVLEKDADGAGLALEVAKPACWQIAGGTGLEAWPNDAPGLPDGLDKLDILVGPDTFGYTLRDQAEAGSVCAFNFVDIAATGTILGNGDDTSFLVDFVSLGAPAGTTFNLYGTNNAQLRVSTNGFVTTTDDTAPTTLSNDCPLPTTGTNPGDRLLVLHDDLDVDPANPGGATNILAQYFATCPRQSPFCGAGATACTVIQWNNVSHFPGSSTAVIWDMQSILYHRTGEMITQIGPGNPEATNATLNSSTTGLHNGPPTTGLLYSCRTSSTGQGPGFPGPGDNSAICYRHPTLTVSGNCPVSATATPPPSVGGFDVGDALAESAPAATTPAPAGTGNSLLVLALVVGGAAAAAAAWGMRR